MHGSPQYKLQGRTAWTTTQIALAPSKGSHSAMLQHAAPMCTHRPMLVIMTLSPQSYVRPPCKTAPHAASLHLQPVPTTLAACRAPQASSRIRAALKPLSLIRALNSQTPATTATAGNPTTTTTTVTTTTSSSKQRLDSFCQQLYPQHSKRLIQSWIAEGLVTVNNKVITKPGFSLPPHATITIAAAQPMYVCRAGHKLEAALEGFGIDVAGWRVLDAGLSTGGFADCLLQRGAAQVVGVDVGHSQVSPALAADPRLVVMERTNIRALTLETHLGGRQVDAATLDLSFISLRLVLPVVVPLVAPGGTLVVLVKPQFEAGPGATNAAGRVTSDKVRQAALSQVLEVARGLGCGVAGTMESPLKGDRAGNTEYLVHLVVGAAAAAAGGTQHHHQQQQQQHQQQHS